MPLNLKTFYTRTLTGFVFIVVMLSGICINFELLIVLVCLLNLGCIFEYSKIIFRILKHKSDMNLIIWYMFLSGILIYFFAIFRYNDIVRIFSIIGLVLAYFFHKKKPKYSLFLYFYFGLIYITLSFSLLLTLAQWHKFCQDLTEAHWRLPLFLFLNLWVSDSLAYLFGSLFGKTKLTKWSPKKTWEGTISGIILTLILVLIFGNFLLNFNKIWLMLLSLITTIFGTIGDIFESKLKRQANIKDSGNILPGHGGFLDRLDSVLLATPAVFIVLYLKELLNL